MQKVHIDVKTGLHVGPPNPVMAVEPEQDTSGVMEVLNMQASYCIRDSKSRVSEPGSYIAPDYLTETQRKKQSRPSTHVTNLTKPVTL